ncbi:DUF4179 domain-containing protein [Streptomyces gilvosporeus]|uniref:ATP-binding protein n=1 Tax=Streptomyces gilvosporeus TaxID=553510 RepID=A0A1V0TLM1_9ACTN|nr:DUF4179 domain-containing protein [Streptomyces gilvosporeus]ARF53827.1 hypothetical protein B1H19_06225 [Streptomyces gilvosporeus]
MKIAKAAAGVVGVALALGAASPALAASGPHGEKNALPNSDTITKSDVKNPLADLDIDGLVRSVDKVAGKLKTPNGTHPKTTHAGEHAKPTPVGGHDKTHSGGHAKAHEGGHAKTHSGGHAKAHGGGHGKAGR